MIRTVGTCAGGALPSLAAGSQVSTNSLTPSSAVRKRWSVCAALPYSGCDAGLGSHAVPRSGADAAWAVPAADR